MIEHIKNSNKFKVIFDRTKGKFNDDGWETQKDDSNNGCFKGWTNLLVTLSLKENILVA